MPLPIVLLHAFPLSARMWEPLRAVSALSTLRTPDSPGAPGVPIGDVAPSLDVLADDVAALLDREGIDRAIVGGLSMGGYVTMAFARRHRERIAGVVLADTKANADDDQARANRLRMAEVLEREGSARVLIDETFPTLIGSTTKSERPGVRDFVAELVARAEPASAAWWLRAMAARPDSFATLRGLDVPALVISGDEDPLTSAADAQAMVEALPRAQLTALPRAGHLTAVETPAAFEAALAGFVATVG